ncbi:MAG: HAD family hydrolase [Candidatus Saccharibacteria bacterium]|nr:HAD family hydrolase [Pseudorhodobacter sp.]
MPFNPADLTTIGFDADDTLWHNETLFHLTQARFAALLADHTDPANLAIRMEAAERRNLRHYGFGVKGFMLSMIETAIDVTEGRVQSSVISEILAAGREMLAHPVELLPHVRPVIEQLAGEFTLLLITKGDLLDQERKVAQSGLGDLFAGVEIVSDKTPEVYARIFTRHGAGPDRAMMVGNSLKSDVLPALQAGAWGVHVPQNLTWALEHADPPKDAARFRCISDLGALPQLLREL